MKKIIPMLLIMFAMVIVGCSAHVHTVGNGPQTGEVESARQWYLLYGIIPINTVDTGAMAIGSDNYEITTVTGPIDILIGIPALYVTVSSRTVTVTR